MSGFVFAGTEDTPVRPDAPPPPPPPPRMKTGPLAHVREDREKIVRVLDFLRRLRHTQGHLAGTSFVPMEWQINEIIRPIFGRVNAEGYRITRKGIIWIPKKNGKSTLAAGLALYLLMADGEAGAEVASAAADKDQAKIVYNMAYTMAKEAHHSVERKLSYGKGEIEHPDSNSRYYAVSSDVKGRHGPNLHALIFDEIHTQPDRTLWDAMAPAGAARKQPLVIGLSTAGEDKETLGGEQYDYSARIVDGDVENPAYHAVIYAAPENANWTDEAVWIACNPSLGEGVQLDFLRGQYAEARDMPTMQASFKRLHLNRWAQGAGTWVPMEKWDRCEGFTAPPAPGALCFGGLDIASVKDMCAWVLIFPQIDQAGRAVLRIQPTFWVPEALLYDERNQYAPQYRQWHEAGYLRTVPGDVMEYGPLEEQIVQDSQTYYLESANMDRLFQGHSLMLDLQSKAVNIMPMAQTFPAFAAPMHTAERLIMTAEIDHCKNPVMRWMAQNTAVIRDVNNNMRPDKRLAKLPIDGIVAWVMAVDRWSRTVSHAGKSAKEIAARYITRLS